MLASNWIQLRVGRRPASMWFLLALGMLPVVRCNLRLYEDIFAQPAYNIVFATDPIALDDATAKMQLEEQEESRKSIFYEIMKKGNVSYLCAIPTRDSALEQLDELNKTRTAQEVARAKEHGIELLHPLEDECLYYISGWWTYVWCHNRYVKQFHQSSFSSGTFRYPPQPDPNTEVFILGQIDDVGGHDAEVYRRNIMEQLEISEQNYLVQRLGQGSMCGLIGEPRSIEIQFQCNPGTSDRIAWVREVSTCKYLMVIWTPRLCHDVMFAKSADSGSAVNQIFCERLLPPKRGSDDDKGPMLELEDVQIFGESESEKNESKVLRDATFNEQRHVEPDQAELNIRTIDIPEVDSDSETESPLPKNVLHAARSLRQPMEESVAKGNFLHPLHHRTATKEDVFDYFIELRNKRNELICILNYKIHIGKVISVKAYITSQQSLDNIAKNEDVFVSQIEKHLDRIVQEN